MDEMEGLAIKITRAEWGVLKGWVPEIVANEVAGKLVEVIRPLLADAIAAKDATIAAQAAEIERLTKEAFANAGAFACLEGIHDQMYAELAALRSQLEEQRKRLDGEEPNH